MKILLRFLSVAITLSSAVLAAAEPPLVQHARTVFEEANSKDTSRLAREIAASFRGAELKLEFIVKATQEPPDDISAALNSWKKSLKNLSGVDPVLGDVYGLLSRVADIENGQIRAILSLAYVWRLNGISPVMVEEWQAAVESATGEKVSKNRAATLIVQSSYLFQAPPEAAKKLITSPSGKSDEFENYQWRPVQGRWQSYLKRLRSISREDVIKASEISINSWSGNTFRLGPSLAAARMAEVDSLFNDGQFQHSQFSAAAPQIEQAERGREQKNDNASTTMTLPSKPLSDWPKYAGELYGRNEVRVKNPNQFSVTVGLRSQGLGTDFVVSTSSTRSTFVPDGRFEIYFIYSNEPEAVYKGDDVTLTNRGVEIQIVKETDGNYGIRKFK